MVCPNHVFRPRRHGGRGRGKAVCVRRCQEETLLSRHSGILDQRRHLGGDQGNPGTPLPPPGLRAWGLPPPHTHLVICAALPTRQQTDTLASSLSDPHPTVHVCPYARTRVPVCPCARVPVCPCARTRVPLCPYTCARMPVHVCPCARIPAAGLGRCANVLVPLGSHPPRRAVRLWRGVPGARPNA